MGPCCSPATGIRATGCGGSFSVHLAARERSCLSTGKDRFLGGMTNTARHSLLALRSVPLFGQCLQDRWSWRHRRAVIPRSAVPSLSLIRCGHARDHPPIDRERRRAPFPEPVLHPAIHSRRGLGPHLRSHQSLKVQSPVPWSSARG